MANSADWIDYHGLRALRLATPDGASAIVARHGAQVLSWVPACGGERLYLSDKSPFDAGTAIRGGVPVVFPQFGTLGPLPRHGFVRTAEWDLLEQHGGKDFASATFRLLVSPQSRPIWPHDFAAELTVAVGADRLDIELEVENLGAEEFAFTAALHTYLKVAEVETVRLEGLRGTRYRDQTRHGNEHLDRGNALVVADEVDRIYLDAPATLLLRQPGASLGIHSEGFPDVVVWNPWEKKCAAMADMPRDGFRRMLCVEAAVIGRPVVLAAGQAWWARQSLQVV